MIAVALASGKRWELWWDIMVGCMWVKCLSIGYAPNRGWVMGYDMAPCFQPDNDQFYPNIWRNGWHGLGGGGVHSVVIDIL